MLVKILWVIFALTFALMIIAFLLDLLKLFALLVIFYITAAFIINLISK